MLTAFLLAAATFNPLGFFTGHTSGDGRLKVVLRRGVPVSVSGSGRVESDGTLVLDQTVLEGTKPARTRRWRLQRTAPGRYEGTLTDARGPVVGEVNGRRLYLRFTSTSGFRVRQWLTLSADGRSADNLLKASRLGVTVATLRERIRRID